MRRIYDSNAMERHDEKPFHPNERDAKTIPQSMRTVPASVLSRHLIPHWVRFRAISVDIVTPRQQFDVGEPIRFVVTMKNAMPFPIELETNSSVVWNWYVDGCAEASTVPSRSSTSRETTFSFDRGERKQFYKHWDQMFHTTKHTWEPAVPGTYTISTHIDIDDPEKKGLQASTVVEIS